MFGVYISELNSVVLRAMMTDIHKDTIKNCDFYCNAR
jgi:hypothetical protein